MKTKLKEFENRLETIYSCLQQLQVTQESLVKSDTPETKALALGEEFRKGYLVELEILKVEIAIEEAKESKRRFWWLF